MAPNNPHCGTVAPLIKASRRRIPFLINIWALSVTTMALSTSMPIAIIKAASDVRFNPTPINCIISIVPPIEKINEEPINNPARVPITSKIIKITITTDSTRFNRKPLFASRAISFSG